MKEFNKGCKKCIYNQSRTLKNKECLKGHRTVYGFRCRDFKTYEIGYQFTIYDYLNERSL